MPIHSPGSRARTVSKFGFDISHTEDFTNSLTNRFGSYTYSNVTTFAEDYTSPTPGPSHYSTYVQAFGNSDRGYEHHRSGLLCAGYVEK